ncbi:hypothetical protein H8959_007908 [Pygathrix nigripes]
MDQPTLALRQAGTVCTRLFNYEEKIWEEYEQILNTKLAEQHESFVKFTHDQIMRPCAQAPPPPVRLLLRPLPARGLPGDKDRVPSGRSHAAAASGAFGAADWLGVQVSDARSGRPGRDWGHRGGGGGVSGRRRAEALTRVRAAEIAHPAFCPGSSCEMSPAGIRGTAFAAVGRVSPRELAAAERSPAPGIPSELASSEGEQEWFYIDMVLP